ncbi:MAG: serine hydrolase domain-containing protein [Bacteroidota bacterium]
MGKYLLFIPLLLGTQYVLSQEVEKRIQHVENGLTFQTIVPNGREIPVGNLAQKLKEYRVPGASVAVVHDGKIQWSKAYGKMTSNGPSPITTETLFQAASIGKVITALAALKVVEEGKIDLDENINNKLMGWKVKENENTKTEKVTLRRLLSHSAGLTDDYGFLGYSPKDNIPSAVQILKNEYPAKTKKSLAIKTVPGQVERYSGAGYVIIQVLIEDISGNPFSQYVQEHILDPFGMVHTTYDNNPDTNLGSAIASGHLANGKSLKNKKYNIYPEKAAAGPWTTAEDLARLLIGIQKMIHGENTTFINRDLIDEFLSPQINHKGLGVNLKGLEKPVAFWHAGQNLGYTGLLYGLMEQGNVAVILLNSDGGEILAQEFITSVAHEYNWPVMKSYTSQGYSRELKAKLIGKYKGPDSPTILVIEENNGVMTLRPSSSKKGHPLLKIDENQYTFQDAQDYYKLSFTFEDAHCIMTYVEGPGKTMQMEKLD